VDVWATADKHISAILRDSWVVRKIFLQLIVLVRHVTVIINMPLQTLSLRWPA